MRNGPKTPLLRGVLLAAVALFAACAGPGGGAPRPVPVIFDTDMDSDCDDVAALALLHALADRGEARILATPVSGANPWSPACVDALNGYFGRPELPIGAPRRPGASLQVSRFARGIAEAFPHDTPGPGGGEDAVAVYRRVLAAEADGTVTIVTVGDLTNLRHLLESGPDAQSPWGGGELVRRKVVHWVCMGSRYPADLDPGRWGNFKMDPESTRRAVAGWPGRITFTGGGAFAQALATGEGLRSLPVDNPVRRAYELYFDGTARNRHSADQIATWIAVRGTGAPWALVRGGSNEIFPDGRHAWREEPDDARQAYISALAGGVDARALAGEIEALMKHVPAAVGKR